MKNQLAVLVVEDNDKHFIDFCRLIAQIGDKLPIKINPTRADNLEEAMSLLPQADAVMTDLFFPAKAGGDEEPSGRNVVEACLNSEKPVVWITSTYHHGEKTNDHSRWGREHGLEMFDCNVEEGQTEAPNKPWKHALMGLLTLVVGLELGQYKFESGKLMQREDRESDQFELLDGAELNRISGDLIGLYEPVVLRMLQLGFGRTCEE